MEKKQFSQHIVIDTPSTHKRTVRAIVSAAILTCACAYFFGASVNPGDSQVRKAPSIHSLPRNFLAISVQCFSQVALHLASLIRSSLALTSLIRKGTSLGKNVTTSTSARLYQYLSTTVTLIVLNSTWLSSD
jgi:hypothetical protein